MVFTFLELQHNTCRNSPWSDAVELLQSFPRLDLWNCLTCASFRIVAWVSFCPCLWGVRAAGASHFLAVAPKAHLKPFGGPILDQFGAYWTFRIISTHSWTSFVTSIILRLDSRSLHSHRITRGFFTSTSWASGVRSSADWDRIASSTRRRCMKHLI